MARASSIPQRTESFFWNTWAVTTVSGRSASRMRLAREKYTAER
jgi:hypothetical protein